MTNKSAKLFRKTLCDPVDLRAATKMTQLYHSANSRGLEFNLSFDTVKALYLQKYCYYTGVRMTDEINSPNQRTIDRVDSFKGYVEGNVVACTKEINSKKGSLTSDDIKALYEGYQRHTGIMFKKKFIQYVNVKLFGNGR